MDGRKLNDADTFLNFKGKIPDQVGRFMGPDYNQDWHTVVAQEYDAYTDTTRLGLVTGVIHLDQ